MIKDNQKVFNRIHIFIDALVLIISYVLAFFIRFQSNIISTLGKLFDLEARWAYVAIRSLELQTYFIPLLFIVPVYLILYARFNLYTSKRAAGRKQEFLNICKANIAGGVCFLVILFVVKDFSRAMIGSFIALNVVLETFVRNCIRYILRFFRKRGFNLKYVLLVGYSHAAEAYIDRIRLNPQWGYVVRGILDDKTPRGTMYKGIKVIGSIDNLTIILPENKLDEIAITLSLDDYGRLDEIVNMCEKSGVHTKFIPDYGTIIASRPYTEDIMGLPVINIRYLPLSNTFNMLAKRGVDIIGSIVGLIVFSPVMLASVIAIKLTSPGPVIFSQERIGLHNKPYKMYKFRTMQQQPPQSEERAWTVKDDPRVTRVGKLLRKTSMDEVPQMWNILRGDMSLVGPRPERPLFVEKFREEIPRYMVKHQVRPGLTGWAQINGYRGDTSIHKRIEYDLYYIENWTMGMDIKIILLTIFKGFVNKNAY